jgi:hypothetical protein
MMKKLYSLNYKINTNKLFPTMPGIFLKPQQFIRLTNSKSLYKTQKYNLASNQIMDLTNRPLAVDKLKLHKLSKVDAEKSGLELKMFLYNKIKLTGPMPLDEYMKICLYDKKYGYYTTKDYIFGEKGDFITAPEISQMFGESIAIFIYKILEDSFKFPKKWDLLEIGAGRGFLMADIILSMIMFRKINGMNVIIVETSDKLAKIQQENINNILLRKQVFTEYVYDTVHKIDTFIDKKNNFSIKWFSSLEKYIQYRNGLILEDDSNQPFKNILKFKNPKEDSSHK